MNTALNNQYPGLIEMLLNYPDVINDRYMVNGREITIADCNRYRALIYTKLSGWLKQRAFALNTFDPRRAKEARTLLLLIGVYEKTTLQNICRFVARHSIEFSNLSPGSNSRFIKHYENKVVPIINLCKQIAA